jgi:hypothetical protein
MKMPKEAEDKDDDLRDVVSAAMESATQDEGEDDGKERDESGKFVAKQGESEAEAAARLQPEDGKAPKEGEQKAPKPADEKIPAEGQQPEGERLLTEDKAPRGWSPASREKWSTLPDDIRAEILRREEASAVGVRQLQERYVPIENFVRNLDPFIQEAAQHGIQADQYIYGVMNTERILRTADVPGKFQALLQIADQYGIPLRDVINESVGSRVLPPAQTQQDYIPPAIAQELQAMRQWREQQESQGVMSNIHAFAQGKEFFEDVRNHMAVLIETGAANSLEDAYDASCWAVPTVRQVMLQRQGTDKKAEDLKKRQEAAGGASLTPNGALDVDDGDDKDDDLADTVRKAYAGSVSGRV